MADIVFQDRVVATPQRITLTHISGSTYDYVKVPGAVSVEGTPLNATNMNLLVQKTQIAYDKIIKSQADFEALIASSNWLGAVSVALVGQFTLSTASNSGIKIPQTVKQIHGFNSAKITVTTFKHNSSTAKGGLWYDTRPTTLDYSIRDLEVDCRSVGGGLVAYGFVDCTNLTNCTGTADGFAGCGFAECSNLMNCIGKGEGATGNGFRSCTNLTNCTGTGTGTGTGGYGFYNITTASNCSDGGSSSNMWGGTNKNIDIDTCCKTPVDADNATLNT